MKTQQTRPENRHAPWDSDISRRFLLVLLALGILFALTFIARGEETTTPLGGVPTAAFGPTAARPNRLQIPWFRRQFGKVSWDEAVAWCKTPADVCGLVSGQIRYSDELGDDWNSARETWESRSGDCEDFAIAIVELCREIGIDAWVEVYFGGRGPGHAVAVGVHNGSKWMSSVGRYERVRSDDEIRQVVAATLMCSKDRMWSAHLSYESIVERTRH